MMDIFKRKFAVVLMALGQLFSPSPVPRQSRQIFTRLWGNTAVVFSGMKARKWIFLLLAMSPALVRAEELRHTFAFATPYIDASHGTPFHRLILFTPLELRESFLIHGRVVSLDGAIEILSYSLSGSCQSLDRVVQCHLEGAFHKLNTVIRLEGRDTWGEVQSLGGAFGYDYNGLGLAKTETTSVEAR